MKKEVEGVQHPHMEIKNNYNRRFEPYVSLGSERFNSVHNACNSFNPHDTHMQEVLLSFPFHR